MARDDSSDNASGGGILGGYGEGAVEAINTLYLFLPVILLLFIGFCMLAILVKFIFDEFFRGRIK